MTITPSLDNVQPLSTFISSAASQKTPSSLDQIKSVAATATPGERLTPDLWRAWPVVPTLSARSIEIIKAAAKNRALDSHIFSRVGDCQFTTETFMAGYVKGLYAVPEGLQATTFFYKESMARDSIPAAIGKAFLGAFLVGIPLPITGTILGAAILLLSGLPHHPVEAIRKIAERGRAK